ncbi:haloacid dehalogenase type II [Effusibacillus dendaii]|uniref:Haloacid dehalogenase n=1 Tax=Effusibacillus dendaii TaxID=2743772 RepID=A0A7I8DDU8_9BACL|nr:haloacid dehalogenase type II [Effusibacillus dendaii]BCJ88197.1 haloacid dehalogenase [Effusibacillus dendaii]
MAQPQVKALIFDTFGTLVDYRTTIIREGAAWNQKKGWTVDWAKFADEWRGQYRPNMDKVMRGELPWMNIDQLHRMALEELLPKYGINDLSEAEKTELNTIWHRLLPWGDTVMGLTYLGMRYTIAPLSNGNVALLSNMAKHARLPWDLILSAELAKAYKPDPRVYQTAVNLLGLQPEQVMMVAAHQEDLLGAQKVGLKTAFILRPLEFGWSAIPDLTPDPSFDVVANDIVDLARQLDCC